MAASKEKAVVLTKSQELEILRQYKEKVRKNPKLGLKTLKNAGIYDANGHLTEPYRVS